MGFATRHPSSPRSTVTILLQNTIRYTIFILGIAALSASAASAQCLAFGADTTCGVVITVIQTGNSPCPPQGCASLSFTGQGPYDGIDDTLVGVINSSNLPITSLVLTSGNNIFAFDGDGVDTYGAPGNAMDSTGYGGPNAYFTNISADATTGTVNFITPIPPGKTAYFSLENALGAATACSDAINNSVPKPNPGGSPTIFATFTPNFGYTLAQAAQLCGFIEFDWQSTVTYFPLPAPYWYAAGSTTPATYPHNDPPLTGYAVNPPGQPPNAVELPVYWNLFITALSDPLYPLSLAANEIPSGPNATMLSFQDTPGDPCLPGGDMKIRKAIILAGLAPQSCLAGVSANNKKPYEAFTTHLVGIFGDLPGAAVVDTGIGFDWITTNNGTTGGITVLNTVLPRDPGSGTGGVTVTNVNEITSYQYPKSFGVTAINGTPVSPQSSTSTLLTPDRIAATASGLAYSRVTQTFNGTVTITNISSSSIAGPFQIVLNSLTSGVTLTNATGSFGGWQYVTVPGVGSLAPGQSATVNVEFKNPSNAAITLSPIPYSGSFN